MTLGVYSRTRGSLLSWISWFWCNRHTVFRNGDLFNLDEIRRDNVLCSAFDRNGRFAAKEMAQYKSKTYFSGKNCDSLLLNQFCLEFSEFLLRVSSNNGLDSLRVFLEFHTEGLGHELDIELLVNVGFGQAFLDDELLLGSVGVNSQVVCASIGTADTLDPAVGGLDLKVPTVLKRVLTYLVQARSSMHGHLQTRNGPFRCPCAVGNAISWDRYRSFPGRAVLDPRSNPRSRCRRFSGYLERSTSYSFRTRAYQLT